METQMTTETQGNETAAAAIAATAGTNGHDEGNGGGAIAQPPADPVVVGTTGGEKEETTDPRLVDFLGRLGLPADFTVDVKSIEKVREPTDKELGSIVNEFAVAFDLRDTSPGDILADGEARTFLAGLWRHIEKVRLLEAAKAEATRRAVERDAKRETERLARAEEDAKREQAEAAKKAKLGAAVGGGLKAVFKGKLKTPGQLAAEAQAKRDQLATKHAGNLPKAAFASEEALAAVVKYLGVVAEKKGQEALGKCVGDEAKLVLIRDWLHLVRLTKTWAEGALKALTGSDRVAGKVDFRLAEEILGSEERFAVILSLPNGKKADEGSGANEAADPAFSANHEVALERIKTSGIPAELHEALATRVAKLVQKGKARDVIDGLKLLAGQKAIDAARILGNEETSAATMGIATGLAKLVSPATEAEVREVFDTIRAQTEAQAAKQSAEIVAGRGAGFGEMKVVVKPKKADGAKKKKGRGGRQ